ncbi:hypothetical protein C0Z18_31895 [Trinickia dabaoshanensis]|uniref:Uncharacterized protein n=1 Tax=Trinickia dabaoshanensis TaxID=564714 RepID=A0A2N7VB37_9BURK|nr:hypothetical protein [Trinickia dabaoshanensis]PMS14366.1 hypothetical protein C0Z18_31895 [Trinickia dabaoshanensis]
MTETNLRGAKVNSVLTGTVGVQPVSTARLTLDELEDYYGMTGVLREYGLLLKDDMKLLEAMVRRHECLRTLIPYAVSPDAKDRAFATKNISLLRAAIELADEEEHLNVQRDDCSSVESN